MKRWLKIFYWMLVTFTLYLLFEVIRKIFGGSLGFEELIAGLLVANLGYTIALQGKISDINVKLSEHLGWHKAHRLTHK